MVQGVRKWCTKHRKFGFALFKKNCRALRISSRCTQSLISTVFSDQKTIFCESATIEAWYSPMIAEGL